MLISPLVKISSTLFISSFSIPFLAAFFIDLISVSKVLDVSSIKNFKPFNSPINCPSIRILLSRYLSIKLNLV